MSDKHGGSINPDSLLKRLLQGAGVVFLVHGAGSATKFISQLLMGRWLGAYEFGEYAYAFNWTLILSTIALLGFGTTALRFIPAYLVSSDFGLLRGMLRFARLLSGGAGFAIAAAASLIVLAIPPSGHSSVVLLAALWITPLQALVTLNMQMIRSTRDMVWAYGPPILVQPLVHTAAIVGLYSIGRLSAVASLAAVGASMILTLLLQQAGLRRTLPQGVYRSRREYRRREWMQVASPLLLVSLFVMIQNRTDLVFVGWLRGSEEAGIYSAVLTISMLLNFVLVAVNAIMGPTISHLYAEGSKAELQRTLRQVTAALAALSVLIGLGLVLFGRYILGFFGPEYRFGYAALVFITVGQVINVGAGPVAYIMNLTGHQAESARIMGISAGVNVLLTSVLTLLYGINGAAFATMLTTIIWNTWLSVAIRHRLDLRTFIFLLRSQSASVPGAD